MRLSFTICAILVVLLIFAYLALIFIDRKKLYLYWNQQIELETQRQNESDRAFYMIPSLQSAWVCHHSDIKSIQLTTFLIHDILLNQVEEYFNVMIGCVDSEQEGNLGGIRYLPIYLNGKKTSLYENFKLPDSLVTSCHEIGLLILEPDSRSTYTRLTSKGVYRYHYALKLPEKGNFGLCIKGKEKGHHIKWKERQGIIWDPTIDHYIVNENKEDYCFLLTADIPRSYTWKHNWINWMLHTYFPLDDKDYERVNTEEI